jgi:hypothetical protein
MFSCLARYLISNLVAPDYLSLVLTASRYQKSQLEIHQDCGPADTEASRH